MSEANFHLHVSDPFHSFLQLSLQLHDVYWFIICKIVKAQLKKKCIVSLI